MRIPSILLAIVIASQLGATDCGQVLRDQGFDLWCGDQLCAWKLERGSIEQVPTWNEGDHGVALVGSDTAIEQLTPESSGDGTCIELTMVANVDPSVDVELNIDIYGDGSIEHHERLPAAKWKALTYDLLLKGPYYGVRFELAKTGSGTAELANIGAKTLENGCAGLVPIVAAPAPLGAECDPQNGATCASGLCTYVSDPDAWLGLATACAGCDAMHGCGSDEVCGLHEPTSPVYEASDACVAAGSKQLGERCDGGGECASGMCLQQRCSACPGTCACGASWTGGPSVCNAGQHLGAAGAPCGTDDDCASASCAGTPRMECEDGRPCASAIDCPFGTGSNGALANGACITVGIQGGSCR